MSQRNRRSYLYIYSLIVVWLTTSLLSNFLFCFYSSSLSPQAWAPLCATQHEHTASLLEASVDIVAKNMVLISLFWVKLDPWVFYSLMWHHIHRDTGYRDVLALSLCCLATLWRLVTKELSRIDITWNSFPSVKIQTRVLWFRRCQLNLRHHHRGDVYKMAQNVLRNPACISQL